MGTATSSVLSNELHTHGRRAVIIITGSASYATGGDTINLSALEGGGFTKVHGVSFIAMGIGGAANDKYRFAYVPAASYAPATGVLKIRDLSAASDAEVSSTTDLSAVTWIAEVVGV